jgi:GH35 family endo-1,4-beta-xylanase
VRRRGSRDARRALAIAADLLGKGVPIDGVGHPLHLDYEARASDAVPRPVLDPQGALTRFPSRGATCR